MLGTVALGLSPVVAFGLMALWTRMQANRLEVVDMTGVAPAAKRSKRRLAVDAVVLHQMGFSRGNDLQRYRKVTAHFVIAPNGQIAQLHPVSARLAASHGFNARSVAVEFAGNLRAATGRWWRPDTYGRDTLTAAQIAAGRRLLRALRAQGLRFVFAHRQSSSDRGNDPGPEIWSSVAQWAIDRLGMSAGESGYAIDTGAPIPESWRSYRAGSTAAS